MKIRFGSLAVAAMTLLPVPSHAQAAAPGTRVRVVMAPEAKGRASDPAIGRLVALDDESLVLDRGDGLDTIPMARVRRVDVRAKQSIGASVLHGTWLGAVIGGGAGLIAGAAFHDGYSCSDGGFCVSAGAGAVTGGVLGAAVGSIVGLISGTGEHWQRGATRPEVTVIPGRHGALLIGLSLRR